MSVLLEQGHSQSAVARLLGVSEGTVRYHRKRMKDAVMDGRSKQVPKAAAFADVIEAWRSQQAGGRINLALLHDWLRREHGYTGSLKSVQRHWKRTYPAPKIRARRRVETPPGAQAQVDWVEYPGVTLGREEVDLAAPIVTLSWSRKRAVVWARCKDMLSWLSWQSWQSCQIGCLRRLGGVPAVLRIDNVKTAIASGGGSWGKINEIYRRFATQLRFHVDACQPRHPQGKGKVERHAQDLRLVVDPRKEHFDDLAALQAATDSRLEDRARELTCPVYPSVVTALTASLFFRLVSYRYGRGAMVITTNKSIRDWTELLAGDEVLATAILDRLLHRSHVLNIKGRSYRLRDLEDALKG